MPGIAPGMMSTSQAAMVQRMEEEERKKKRAAMQKGSAQGSSDSADKATAIGSGASLVGSLGGPVGTVIGAGIGAIAGGVSANEADKAEDPNRPERRGMTAILQRAKDRKDKRHMAMATLAESVFNWAQSAR